MRRAKEPIVRARAALLWALAVMAVSQLALIFAMRDWKPEWRDPEFGHRLLRLRARLAAAPDRPLVLILGSSRAAMGLRPDALPDCRTADGRRPIVFNFSVTGAGPVMELLYLRRLLRRGIHPDWVLAECWPPYWHQEGPAAEVSRFAVHRLEWQDLPLWDRYWGGARDREARWCEARLAPFFTSRFILLSEWAPAWLPMGSRQEWKWREVDEHGWLPCQPSHVDPEQRRRRAEWNRDYYAVLLRHFAFSPVSDQALRELFALCRDENIRVALFLMPEGSEFRSWYPPALCEWIEAYTAELTREYQVPVIDTRAWAADADFVDSSHLVPAAAAAFTNRFGREVLQPVLLGRVPGVPPATTAEATE
jgi:hypothetical protein